jgi:hypothetical protein
LNKKCVIFKETLETLKKEKKIIRENSHDLSQLELSSGMKLDKHSEIRASCESPLSNQSMLLNMQKANSDPVNSRYLVSAGTNKQFGGQSFLSRVESNSKHCFSNVSTASSSKFSASKLGSP